MIAFIRTCQECGHTQKDIDPMGNPSNAFLNRKCRKCKSEGLDYGSDREMNEEKAKRQAAIYLSEMEDE